MRVLSICQDLYDYDPYYLYYYETWSLFQTKVWPLGSNEGGDYPHEEAVPE